MQPNKFYSSLLTPSTTLFGSGGMGREAYHHMSTKQASKTLSTTGNTCNRQMRQTTRR